MNETTEPRAVVKFTRSTTSGKEGYEVVYEHPDHHEALRVATWLRHECRIELDGNLTEQLEASLAKAKGNGQDG